MHLQRIDNPEKELPEIEVEDGEPSKKKIGARIKDKFGMEGMVGAQAMKMLKKFMPRIKAGIEANIPKGINWLKGIDETPKYDFFKTYLLAQKSSIIREMLTQCNGETTEERYEDLFYSVILKNEETYNAYMDIHFERMIVIHLNEAQDDAIVQIMKRPYCDYDIQNIELDGEDKNISLERIDSVDHYANKFLNAEDLESFIEIISQ